MITEEQRAFMRQVFCAFEWDVLNDQVGRTDHYIDWLVTVYETGEPPQEWKMVKEL